MNNYKPIHASSPCSEDFNKMKVCSEGLYCGSCQKHLLDLRKNAINEVHEILETKSEACILVNERYTEKSSSYERYVNKVERFFLRIKMKRISFAAVAALLFLGGCRAKTYCGGWGKAKNTETIKENKLHHPTDK